jgi:hypothetical protein
MSVQIYKQHRRDRFLSSSTLIHNFCIALITGVVCAVRAEATADGSFIAIMLAITQFRIIYKRTHEFFFICVSFRLRKFLLVAWIIKELWGLRAHRIFFRV